MDRKQQAIRARLHAEGDTFRPVRAAYEEQRPRIRALVVEASTVGIPQTEICEATGYTRENIRQINRAAEIEQARKAARRGKAPTP